jgi:tetratricopeptide (TPR) repeat protein
MTRLELRPQPLGILSLPAGYLVLPTVAGAADLRDELIAGRVPDAVSPELRFYLLALRGQLDSALASLRDDHSPIAAYNRFVLHSEQAEYQRLSGELSGDLALLLELVAYTLGWADTPPPADGLAGELAACALSAQAAFAIERDRPAVAIDALEAAVAVARPASPLLAAQLLGDLADLLAHGGAAPAATLRYREALALIGDGALPELRAQLSLRLGILYQELARGQRGPLLEAAKCYQDALRHYNRETAPELFALAQNNLALAYLAMPLTEASDRLRMGIAVQALREALKVYTRADYPEQWVSAQLNLANALQYLPSANPEDHLAESVELYEELLGARDPAADPLGYARLLANQGNALAHLGIFDHARAKLAEAVRLFGEHGDPGAAAAVGEVLESIGQRELERGSRVNNGSVPASAV